MEFKADKDLRTLVQKLIDEKASDIHFPPSQNIGIRINGELVKTNYSISAEETRNLFVVLKSKLPQKQRKYIDETLATYDNAGFSVTLEGITESRRFRVNVARLGEGYYVVLREIRENPPLISELGFNEKVEKGLYYVATRPSGLFLVVGATGSGKSTTLASLIRHINENRRVNIITLEDPIEYVHKPKVAQVVQKELGRDFSRFSYGLHSALREDPDVILVGEIRDLPSLDLCLKASETGHLVFTTLHTIDTVSTIQRLCAMSENETFTRDRLSQVLIGVLAQKLAKRSDGKGRIIVYEMLITNTAVRSLIKEGKDAQIKALIDTLPYSQSFSSSIAERLSQGLIDYETAEYLVTDVKEFERLLKEKDIRFSQTAYAEKKSESRNESENDWEI